LIASLYDHHRTLAGCTAAPTVAVSAGDLSSLGQDADRVAAVESLAVPSGGGGISGDIWVLVLERQAVSTRRASMWCAEVAAVGADEPEPARAVGQDFELTRVVGHVVAFAQQQQIAQVGAAAVDPMDAVMGVQVLGVRTPRGGRNGRAGGAAGRGIGGR
jgi:hypothetical protein